MKSRKAEKELLASLQRDPTQAEIADKVGITEQRLHELRKVKPHACYPHVQFFVVSTKLRRRLSGCSSELVKRCHGIIHGRTLEVIDHCCELLACSCPSLLYCHYTGISMSYTTAAAYWHRNVIS